MEINGISDKKRRSEMKNIKNFAVKALAVFGAIVLISSIAFLLWKTFGFNIAVSNGPEITAANVWSNYDHTLLRATCASNGSVGVSETFFLVALKNSIFGFLF